MNPRFLDTNVLVYALIEPKRKLSPQEQSMIDAARGIVGRIENGEPAVSSVVHLSEFVNIVQRRAGIPASREALSCLLNMESLSFSSVHKDHYLLALEISRESGARANDCLAVVLMSKNDSREIYSFDADFDSLGVKRIIR